MHLLYNITIWLYGIAIHLAAISGHEKAKLWLKGRKEQDLPQEKGIVWMHCASLGEFEQGKPILEGLKKKGEKVLLTFFSPAGYEVKKNEQGIDWVRYLPLDRPKEVKKFLNTVKPKAALFIKYEFWANYLIELQKNNTPTYIISASFRKQQHFFKWYGFWFRKILSGITHFFVQDQAAKELLNSIHIQQLTISGDSRFDRVVANASKPQQMPLIERFKGNKKLIVCGSSWPKDEALLIAAMKQPTDLKFIFAPHELSGCAALQAQSKGLLYTQATAANIQEQQVLIIDSIGMLSKLYYYADLAFIGGGFGAGIHNTLEAAAFGCPLLFGPNHQKFKEAQELIEKGYAQVVSNSQELLTAIDSAKLGQQTAIKQYCQKNTGATASILKALA